VIGAAAVRHAEDHWVENRAERGTGPTAITSTALMAFLVVCLVWGSTYPAIRVMVDSVPPMAGAGARFLTAGLLLLGFVAIRSRARLRIERREALACAVMGLLLPAIGNGLVTVAEQEVPASLAALIVASVPLWIALLRTVGSDRPSALSTAGTIGGFIGLVLLLRTDATGVPTGWTLLVVLASASWAFGSTIQRLLPLPEDGTVTTAYEMAFGGAFLLVASWWNGESWQLDDISTGSVLAWIYLTLAGSLVAFSCYSWLLGKSPLSFVSTYAYVNPVVAVVLGVVWLGESLPALAALGGGITLAGVVVVVRSEGRPRASSRPVTREVPESVAADDPA
jgi:drug/metabolite transporter (DMT)-like permease